MRTKLSSAIALLVLVAAGAQMAPASPQGASSATPATSAAQAQEVLTAEQAERRAEIYYNFTMGHLYERAYANSNNSEDASRAIEFYKKAYALDPASLVIGQELAEMYFIAQRIQDAVSEAQEILRRDPENLSVRRLLVRIYIRSLGDTRDLSRQQSAVALAIDHLKEIIRRDPADNDSALWLARLNRLNNQQDEAEQVLRALLARDPENAAGVDQLTQLLLDGNKSDEAVAILEKAIERSPSAALYNRLGNAYSQKSDPEHAEQAYRKAVDLEPNQGRHLRGLAQALTTQEKHQEAAEVYEKLVAMEPNDTSNHLRLSETYRRLRQLDKAEQQVLLAKQRAPGNLEIIYNEAAIYQAQGRYDDAIRVLSDAVAGVKTQAEFTPARRRTLAILYQLLGQLYRDQQNFTAAINTFLEMAKLGPEEDQRTRPLIIDAYRASRNLTRALEEARRAAADYPKDRSIKIAQAMLHGDNRQPDQAAQILRPLLNNSSDDVEIQLSLSHIYAQGQRFAEAEQAVRQAETFGQQPSDRESTGFQLGNIYARQKKYTQAEQAFEGVLAINPRNAPALNYYGYLLADRGVRLDEAVEMVQRALAEDPNNGAYLDSIGWAYYKQNKLDEAEMYLRKAAVLEMNDPTIFSHLGDVLAKRGHPDQAAAAWERSLAEWHRVPPAEFEAEKVAELEQKISSVKQRLAQQKAPSGPGSQ